MGSRRFLIVQTGMLRDVAPAEIDPLGDFDQMIIAAGGFAAGETQTVKVCAGAPLLEEPNAFRGILITGSSSMVGRPEPWMDELTKWLRRAIEQRTSVLGICFGHQLIAHVLGGTVAPNPNGCELGTVSLTFTEAWRGDPLFGNLPQGAKVQVHHYESVASLPRGARVLASNGHEPHQVVRYARNIWGVQFHPELNADVMRELIASDAPKLASEGVDVEKVLASIADSSSGNLILRRFRELADTLGDVQGSFGAPGQRHYL